ncbi:IgGFc-binding protein-like [Amphiura filiformis]|uniref:IgGFc-binding protein-like n=1 Tax=Amphiura filiformis TaxID=82378 RepID=UPI003B20FB37
MVSVSVPGIGFIHVTNVTQDQGATIYLPREAGIRNPSSVKETKKTVIVIATENVSVHGYYFEIGTASSTDAWFILPTIALGGDYIAVGYHSATHGSRNHFSEFVVTAIEDNTTVYITGQRELSMTLQRYESYQFVSDGVDLTDVTGMYINTDKPVSVMSGHQCAKVPVNEVGCDYLMEHLPPLTILGHHYILSPFLGRTSGYIYRVVSVSPGTTHMSLSGESISLSNGEIYEGNVVTSNEVLIIMVDKPVMVVQYAKGSSTDGFGDPFMVVIPSIQKFSNNVTFPSFGRDQLQHYISIITPGCDSITLFNLDGLPLNNVNWLQSSHGEFCILRSSVNSGFHSVTHPSASFLVLVYGFGPSVSYGFVARCQFHTEGESIVMSLIFSKILDTYAIGK